MENKPASLLVVTLGKTLSVILLTWKLCGKTIRDFVNVETLCMLYYSFIYSRL